jgi:formylglycine-generating enzyme required for sulfatase activity
MKNPIKEGAPTKGSKRVTRGGSWSRDPLSVRASYRDINPTYQFNFLGFRIVRNKK